MFLVWKLPGAQKGVFWARLEPGAEGLWVRPTPTLHPTPQGLSPALDSAT